MPEITDVDLDEMREILAPILNKRISLLSVPRAVLEGFEPGQVGTVVGTVIDVCLPMLPLLFPNNAAIAGLGLRRAPGTFGQREGYPDFVHEPSGRRLELKGLHVDPVGLQVRQTVAEREASARVSQKVTVRNVVPDKDILLVAAYQLQPSRKFPERYRPRIVDLGLFSMIEIVRARDHRLTVDCKGRWFPPGEYKTPAILTKHGRARLARGETLDEANYGRRATENRDYREDDNFGKLRRIPLKALQEFLKKHGAGYASEGTYPAPWSIP